MKELQQVYLMGRILVQLLFLLYINDLPSYRDTSVSTLFAHDTILIVSGATAQYIVMKLE